ncbi:MAG: hypothetical protein EP332_02460 [Bacteroidetes bacterium]|nr:MAG: hypothetical protein EP332_02460 [Bacteroidota bacterium]
MIKTMLPLGLLVLILAGMSSCEKRTTYGVQLFQVIESPDEDEKITIMNRSEKTEDLEGWTLGNKATPISDTIRNVILEPDAAVTFYGKDLSFQIDDYNEVLFLKRPNGENEDTWSN